MKKIEHLKLDFSSRMDFQQPIYCPFTGKLLLPADPFLEFEDYPESVLAVANDFGVHFLSENYINTELQDYESFDDFLVDDESEDYDILDEFASKLAGLLPVESGILKLEICYYGSIPDDFGRWVFFLEAPSIYPVL